MKKNPHRWMFFIVQAYHGKSITSGSRHSRQNNSGHDATDATEAQPQGQVMQRDTQRCSDACADRNR